MTVPPYPRSSPLHLLLLLEWMLLGIVIIGQLVIAWAMPGMTALVSNALGLVLFTVMGLWVPDRRSYKLLYTVIEFGLLLLLSFAGELLLHFLLYVVFVIRNCVMWAGTDTATRRLRSTITILAFLACSLSQSYRLWNGLLPLRVSVEQLGVVWIGFIAIFGLVFLFLQLLVDAMLLERQQQEQLVTANAQLRQYALTVEELAAAQERNRIAREIHDSLGHSLTVFNIHVEAALRLLKSDPIEAESLLLEVKQLGATALQEVRQSVAMLRSDPLQGRSLSESIQLLVSEFQRTTGIQPTCTLDLPPALPSDLTIGLYRLVQESLTNICKHAGATAVTLHLAHRSNHLHITIQDNGKGFDRHHTPTGFGLQGMMERTLALAGELTIATAPGQGCTIQATLPLARSS